MNLLAESIKYIKPKLTLDSDELNTYLTPNERNIWDNACDFIEGRPGSKRVKESRFMKKMPILGIIALYNRTKGHKKELAYIHLSYFFIRLLVLFSSVKLYTKIAERLVPNCLKYSMCLEGVYLTHLLNRKYAVQMLDTRYVKKNLELLELFESEFTLQMSVQKNYIDIISQVQRSKHLTTQLISMIDRYCTEVRELQSEINNPNFLIYKYSILLIGCEIRNKHEESIDVCDEVLFKFKQLPYVYDTGERTFSNKKIEAYIRLKDYDSAETFLANRRDQFVGNKFNKARYLEQCIVLYLRKMNLDKAKKELRNIRTLDTSDFQQLQERIKIYSLFLAVTTQEKVTIQKRILGMSNSITGDLKGMNISLVVIDLVYAILHDDTNYVESQNDPVSLYISRHCKKNRRSGLFIKLLLSVPKINTDWHKWTHRNNNLMSKIKKTEDVTQEIEIFDYEILWAFITSRLLAKNKRYTTYINTPKSKSKYELIGIN